MKITKEIAGAWGIEIPIQNAIKRIGPLTRKNRDEWIKFLYELIHYMQSDDGWID